MVTCDRLLRHMGRLASYYDGITLPLCVCVVCVYVCVRACVCSTHMHTHTHTHTHTDTHTDTHTHTHTQGQCNPTVEAAHTHRHTPRTIPSITSQHDHQFLLSPVQNDALFLITHFFALLWYHIPPAPPMDIERRSPLVHCMTTGHE